MRRNVLIIDNYDSFTYNIIQLIRDNNYVCEVKKNDAITARMIRRFDKILISPGAGIPTDSETIIELIQKYSGKKSMLGICLGHQAIAEAFGGKLIRMKQVVHGRMKKIRILDRNDYLFRALPPTINVGLYHSWAVDNNSLPACLSVTSESIDGILMSIAHKEYDIRGVQFHPESIMTRFGKTIIANWLHH